MYVDEAGVGEGTVPADPPWSPVISRPLGFRCRGYGEYYSIALAAEVFAERWTPIVLRNLMAGLRAVGRFSTARQVIRVNPDQPAV
ncbi:MAG: hypothetical protein ACRDRK_11675 [Pseudonocardia sp.]